MLLKEASRCRQLELQFMQFMKIQQRWQRWLSVWHPLLDHHVHCSAPCWQGSSFCELLVQQGLHM